MGDERDERLREEWAEHPQSAFLGAAGDILGTRAGLGPESPEQRLAREGAPPPQGPSLDELMAHEEPPAVSDFTRGAREVNAEREEGAGPGDA